MTTIDNFDHRILELLQGDGRMPITDLDCVLCCVKCVQGCHWYFGMQCIP